MLGNTPIPQHEPQIPDGAIAESMSVLSGVTDAVFMPWIEAVSYTHLRAHET